MVVIPLILCFATFIENRLRLGHPSTLVALSLYFFCAYSAHCVYGDDTWGVAPGSILLRFQRVLMVRLSPSGLKWL